MNFRHLKHFFSRMNGKRCKNNKKLYAFLWRCCHSSRHCNLFAMFRSRNMEWEGTDILTAPKSLLKRWLKLIQDIRYGKSKRLHWSYLNFIYVKRSGDYVSFIRSKIKKNTVKRLKLIVFQEFGAENGPVERNLVTVN